ncbi:MAG: EAL domain-containing protein [Oligoflexia bacterium]|nr:EAL domain-containing protein [Oligoflexia bacterium]
MSAAFSVCLPPRSLHVLAVETQGDSGSYLADVVNALGHIAVSCPRCEDAFARVEQGNVDLVICDGSDTQASGELGAWMQLRHPTLPMILVKDAADDVTIASTDSAPADGLITEVVGRGALGGAIERIMATQQEKSSVSAESEDAPFEAQDHLALSQLFNQALGGLYLVFQPVVRAKTNCVVGYEVLLRTTSTRFPSASPLLAVAERLGRVQDVDDRVRELLAIHFEDAAQWRTFFVNASVSELTQGVLGTDADPLLPYASRVVMEFSQDFPIPLTPEVLATLARMRECGYRIAAGDINSSTASLVRMRVLAPDIYKLGAALVHRCDQSKIKQRYITEVVEMAHAEGAWVVAQGIERTEEHLTAVELGCDLTQGFLLGVPRVTFD